MKKEEKKKKKSITGPILIFTISLILILVVVWLGFSFFSMRSDNPYVKPVIAIEYEQIADKVAYEHLVEGIDHTYTFPITLLYSSETKDAYKLAGFDTNFLQYFEVIDEAIFEYELDKGKGRYDFNALEWEQSLELRMKYRIREDMSYYTEYSICVLKKVYSNIVGTKNDYAKGYCVVDRDMTEWEIVEIQI